VMPEFWRSLLRQSKPSTLTGAGLKPYLILAHPPLRADGDDSGDDVDDGDGKCWRVDKGESFSSLKLESCTSGFDTLVGGDPVKNGGGDDSKSTP